MNAASSLLGARLRRIDMPRDDLLSLSIAGPELRGVLVFSFSAGASGVGLLQERPHGQPASSFVQKLRKEIEGARIDELTQPSESAVGLALSRGEEHKALVCAFDPPSISLHAAAVELARFDIANQPARRALVTWPPSLDALAARGPELLANQAVHALSQRRLQIDRAVRTAEKRLTRRLDALAEDIRRADAAGPLRAHANLLLGQMHNVARGATSIRLLDYMRDPPEDVVIELDPQRSAREQTEAWFKLARRYERGAQLAGQRRTTTELELAQLNDVRLQLTAADEAELEQLAERARSLGVRALANAGVGRKPAPARHKPYRELRGSQARAILVGKGAADNDALTREHARPQDLWLHVRDVSGAHVVVPLERNETCPQELLLDAAHLAAHFSDARNESIVDVSYTTKRHVRKPRGAAPGKVLVDKEKVLSLHLDPARLRRLLSSEIRD
jgi:predicted ribosome quality control (RQC) complex YloA/Tae2 family protein